MRVIRAGSGPYQDRDVILVPKKGDRYMDVLHALEEAGGMIRHDWTLQPTSDGRWAFVAPSVAP